MRPTRLLCARRTWKYLLEKKNVKSPVVKDAAKAALEFQGIGAGKGFTKYEVDFLETLEWTRELLSKLSAEREKLAAIAAAAKPFEKPDKKPVCVISTDYYSYDFSQPEKEQVTSVGVQVAKLGLSKEQRHSLVVLAGEKYDAYTDSIMLTADEDNRYESLKTCQQQLNALIKVAKENDLTDVKIDLRHLKPKSQSLEFPKQWILRPSEST